MRPIQQTSFVKEVPELFEFEDTTPGELIGPYTGRASGYPDSVGLPTVDGQLKELPPEYVPWWDAIVNSRMRPDQPGLDVKVDALILRAVEHSPQVIAMRIDPVIRETAIIEEQAEFDWTAFIESTFDDNSDPIGNTLTAGGNIDRYLDRNWSGRAGLRKKLDQGGQLDVTQRIGYQNTNSQFFVPDPQGTARLELNFTQPLLRGAGLVYNESRIVLAAVDRQAAEADLAAGLQDHLVAVYETYWSLYESRSIRLQKEKLLQRALAIQKHLKARQTVDTTQRQILRARAAVASRRSEIVRADMAIRNAESRLRLLVNSPELKAQAQREMLPGELPMTAHLDVSLRASIETALQHRPEIARAIRDMNATSVRLGVARNELLPKLDLILGTYVAGLNGGGKIGHGFTKQFSEGRPGYSVGLMLEYPLGNRAARARHERRQWEVAKAFRTFEAAVETGMTDVELSVRELETAWQEMLSRFQSMLASETEATWLFERWRRLPGNDQTVSFLLEDLLEAQKRVADEEAEFVKARVAYVLAIVRLKRATGVLLNFDTSPDPEPPPSPELPPSAATTVVPSPASTTVRPPTTGTGSNLSPPLRLPAPGTSQYAPEPEEAPVPVPNTTRRP